MVAGVSVAANRFDTVPVSLTSVTATLTAWVTGAAIPSLTLTVSW